MALLKTTQGSIIYIQHSAATFLSLTACIELHYFFYSRRFLVLSELHIINSHCDSTCGTSCGNNWKFTSPQFSPLGQRGQLLTDTGPVMDSWPLTFSRGSIGKSWLFRIDADTIYLKLGTPTAYTWSSTPLNRVVTIEWPCWKPLSTWLKFLWGSCMEI